MIRRPPRSTQSRSSAASDVYKRQVSTQSTGIDEKTQGNTLTLEAREGNSKKLYIESYGCAMNFSDSEIVASILADQGFNTTNLLEEADLVLVNTCSIRDKAEQTVRKRLEKYNAVKRINPKMKVGVPVSYTHLRAHETVLDLVCRLLLEKKKKNTKKK
eukprot:TRINITY_DN17132_c0_g1_i1.p1 TRINITY_DN17132_c0_g1~~TRINITY_DN17132_c0_g1_i1.p1  ORF type:complete len:159 (+),score=41.00 TRINITY_DN17132_c0_g1_i1:78-554(+)